MLVFEEGKKPEYPEKTYLRREEEPAIDSGFWVISIKMCETPLSWHTECSLPVAVRVSKTRVLQLTTSFRDSVETSRELKRGKGNKCVFSFLFQFTSQLN